MITNLMNNPPRVEIIKPFNTEPGKVFDAWLDTNMLSKWMFGPDIREEEIIKLENNPQKGGKFSYVVKRDGEEINHVGTYRKVQRPDLLIFTWGVNVEAGDESIVTIKIEPTQTGCRLTLVHEMDPKWKEYTERTKAGWTYMLEILQRYFF
ncbi:SRPBCC family protein [Rhodohalobacter sp. 614A]|uniref:SRPBCC family protein n=1 Tax=Rhodohalobacter sp. 614A TaxID=2908649 RepID=UPI001F383094|nr:SRPBCC family protein [Rhodohalobacter sp. 614A]